MEILQNVTYASIINSKCVKNNTCSPGRWRMPVHYYSSRLHAQQQQQQQQQLARCTSVRVRVPSPSRSMLSKSRLYSRSLRAAALLGSYLESGSRVERARGAQGKTRGPIGGGVRRRK